MATMCNGGDPRDLTEEEALLETWRCCERQRGQLIENAPAAIVSKTLNGIAASWNAGAQHLSGCSAREIVGRSIARVMPADRMDEEMASLARIEAGARIDRHATVRVARHGRRPEVSLTIAPLGDAMGKVVGVSKIVPTSPMANAEIWL